MEAYLKVDIKKSDEKLKVLLEAYEKYTIALIDFENTVREEGMPVLCTKK